MCLGSFKSLIARNKGGKMAGPRPGGRKKTVWCISKSQSRGRCGRCDPGRSQRPENQFSPGRHSCLRASGPGDASGGGVPETSERHSASFVGKLPWGRRETEEDVGVCGGVNHTDCRGSIALEAHTACEMEDRKTLNFRT